MSTKQQQHGQTHLKHRAYEKSTSNLKSNYILVQNYAIKCYACWLPLVNISWMTFCYDKILNWAFMLSFHAFWNIIFIFLFFGIIMEWICVWAVSQNWEHFGVWLCIQKYNDRNQRKNQNSWNRTLSISIQSVDGLFGNL